MTAYFDFFNRFKNSQGLDTGSLDGIFIDDLIEHPDTYH